MTNHLATASRLARELGIGAHTLYGWIERYEDFPEPAAQIDGFGRAWGVVEVREWEQRTRPQRRPGRRRG